jgi:hypothetical protein
MIHILSVMTHGSKVAMTMRRCHQKRRSKLQQEEGFLVSHGIFSLLMTLLA